RFATIVQIHSKREQLATGTSFVPTHANPHGGENLGLTTKLEIASDAPQSFDATNTPRFDFVEEPVRRITPPNEYGPVFDLAVDDCPEFFASSVLVHNCRYGLDPLIKRPGQVTAFGGLDVR